MQAEEADDARTLGQSTPGGGAADVPTRHASAEGAPTAHAEQTGPAVAPSGAAPTFGDVVAAIGVEGLCRSLGRGLLALRATCAEYREAVEEWAERAFAESAHAVSTTPLDTHVTALLAKHGAPRVECPADVGVEIDGRTKLLLVARVMGAPAAELAAEAEWARPSPWEVQQDSDPRPALEFRLSKESVLFELVRHSRVSPAGHSQLLAAACALLSHCAHRKWMGARGPGGEGDEREPQERARWGPHRASLGAAAAALTVALRYSPLAETIGLGAESHEDAEALWRGVDVLCGPLGLAGARAAHDGGVPPVPSADPPEWSGPDCRWAFAHPDLRGGHGAESAPSAEARGARAEAARAAWRAAVVRLARGVRAALERMHAARLLRARAGDEFRAASAGPAEATGPAEAARAAQLAEAARLYSLAIHFTPRSSVLHANRSLVMLKLGALRAAVSDAAQALVEDDSNKKAAHHLLRALAARGHTTHPPTSQALMAVHRLEQWYPREAGALRTQFDPLLGALERVRTTTFKQARDAYAATARRARAGDVGSCYDLQYVSKDWVMIHHYHGGRRSCPSGVEPCCEVDAGDPEVGEFNVMAAVLRTRCGSYPRWFLINTSVIIDCRSSPVIHALCQGHVPYYNLSELVATTVAEMRGMMREDPAGARALEHRCFLVSVMLERWLLAASQPAVDALAAALAELRDVITACGLARMAEQPIIPCAAHTGLACAGVRMMAQRSASWRRQYGTVMHAELGDLQRASESAARAVGPEVAPLIRLIAPRSV